MNRKGVNYMATAKEKQPAAKQPAAKGTKSTAAKQPATEQGGVTLRMLAEKLGSKSEKTLRSRIRRRNGGPVVGRGGRYHWDSWNDPELKALIEDLSKPAPQEQATNA